MGAIETIDLEGKIKGLEEKLDKFLEQAGLSKEEARAESSKLGAKLINPELLPDGAREKVYKGRIEFDEARLTHAYIMRRCDPSGEKGFQIMDAQTWFKEFAEAVERGAFGEAAAHVAGLKKLSTKTISDAAHAALVQTQFMGEYITKRYLLSPITTFATDVVMTQSKVRWPRITSDTPNPDVHARGAPVEPEDIDVDNVELSESELLGGIKLPNSTLRDATPNLMEQVLRVIGIKMRKKADTQYMTGTGTNQPEGLTTGTFSKSIAVDGAFGYDHIIDAETELGSEWMLDPVGDGLCWVGNGKFKGILRKIKDGDLRPILQRTNTSPGAGPAFDILSIPFCECPAIPGAGTPSSPTTAYLAAMKHVLYIGRRQELEIRAFDQTYATSNSTYIRGVMAHDSRIATEEACVELTGIEG
jgi:HK97 family phage major capsid protein